MYFALITNYVSFMLNAYRPINLLLVNIKLNNQRFLSSMFLFGKSQPIDICHISGCGVRPIVTCTPMALHWGQVKLLTRSQKILTLCNDSPVTVYFKASLVGGFITYHHDYTFIIAKEEIFVISLYLVG